MTDAEKIAELRDIIRLATIQLRLLEGPAVGPALSVVRKTPNESSTGK